MSLFKIVQDFNTQLRKGGEQPNTTMLSQRRNSAIGVAAKIAILIIDCSGSMGITDYPPSRLQAAIDSATEYVLTLARQACCIQIAVISFNGQAKVVVPKTQISDSVKIIEGIHSITLEGCTDIAMGLMQAEGVLRLYPERKSQNQIVLLTDGFGGDPVYIAEKLKVQYNTIIDVVGIGGSPKDVNEDLLQKVATTDPDGTSHYRFIKDGYTLKKHYHQLATGLVRKGKSND